MGSSNPEGQISAWWFAILVVVSPLLMSTVFVAWRARREDASEFKESQAATFTTRNTNNESGPRRDLTPILRRMALIVGVAVALYFFLSFVASIGASASSGVKDAEARLIGLLLVVLLTLLAWQRARPTTSSTRRNTTAPFVWMRRMMGATIVVSSAFYLATSLLALPLRHQVDRGLNDMMKNGEVAIIRAQK